MKDPVQMNEINGIQERFELIREKLGHIREVKEHFDNYLQSVRKSALPFTISRKKSPKKVTAQQENQIEDFTQAVEIRKRAETPELTSYVPVRQKAQAPDLAHLVDLQKRIKTPEIRIRSSLGTRQLRKEESSLLSKQSTNSVTKFQSLNKQSSLQVRAQHDAMKIESEDDYNQTLYLASS